MGVLNLNNLTGLIWYVKDLTCQSLILDPMAINAGDLLLQKGHMAYGACTQTRQGGTYGQSKLNLMTGTVE